MSDGGRLHRHFEGSASAAVSSTGDGVPAKRNLPPTGTRETPGKVVTLNTKILTSLTSGGPSRPVSSEDLPSLLSHPTFPGSSHSACSPTSARKFGSHVPTPRTLSSVRPVPQSEETPGLWVS